MQYLVIEWRLVELFPVDAQRASQHFCLVQKVKATHSHCGNDATQLLQRMVDGSVITATHKQ